MIMTTTSNPTAKAVEDVDAAESVQVAQVAQDGDRVAMLSLGKDGTPDQVNPTLIGDKADALAGAQRQFADQAVSAVDAVARRESTALGAPAAQELLEQDPAIAELKAKHDDAAERAQARAGQVVEALTE